MTPLRAGANRRARVAAFLCRTVSPSAMNHPPETAHEEGVLEASDGVRLHTQYWKPSSNPKAVVCIVHGVLEHSGRYAHVAKVLISSAYLVAAIDLRGHGRSQGRRVFVRNFDEYLNDVRCLLADVAVKAPGKPVFLLAHSLGGLIATRFTILERPPLAGLILTGPLFEFGTGISRLARTLAVVLSKLYPTVTLANALDTRKISRDPEVVRSYLADPLNHHGGIPVRTGTEVMRAMAEVNARMEEVRVPLLIFHGTSDGLAHPVGSTRLYTRAASTDKTLRLCEGLFHEVLNEPENPSLLADLVRWLDGHNPTPKEV
jgi:acylglycerol lipase